MKKKNLNVIFSVVAVLTIGLFITNNIKRITENVYAGNVNNIDTYVVQNDANIPTEEIVGAVENGVQVIKFDLSDRSYPNITVSKGKPVKLVINVDRDSLNSCNYVMVSKDMGFQQQLNEGENIIEFTPSASGDYVYSCWMGMIGAYITVVDEEIVPTATYGENVSAGGCCGR